MKTSVAALAYRESAALGATGTGIVILLYDRLIQDIQSATAAMNNKVVEERTRHVSHALLVLQQLQGRLDFAAGGAAAQQLNAFYSHVRGRLLEAQIKQSPSMLEEQAEAVVQVRKCWAQVERSMAPSGETAPAVQDPNVTAKDAEPATMRWGA